MMFRFFDVIECTELTGEYGNAECSNQIPGSTRVFAECIDRWIQIKTADDSIISGILLSTRGRR